MTMLRHLSVAIAASLVAWAGPAAACKGPHLLFSDDFARIDKTWKYDPDSTPLREVGPGPVAPDGGKLKVKPAAYLGWWRVYKGFVINDADICVTLRSPNKISDQPTTDAGLVFWNSDPTDYFFFAFNPAGGAGLYERYLDSTTDEQGVKKSSFKWDTKLIWPSVPGAKLGPGATNTLRVTIEGEHLTLYVNDAQRPFRLKGAQTTGTQVGLRADSEGTQTNTWKFSKFRVTDLPK